MEVWCLDLCLGCVNLEKKEEKKYLQSYNCSHLVYLRVRERQRMMKIDR